VVAFERFFARVSPHVGIEMTRLGKRLRTVLALKGAFPCVNSDMGGQVGGEHKHLGTMWALESLLTRVGSHVCV